MSYDTFLSDLRAFQAALTAEDQGIHGATVRISTFDNKIFLVSKGDIKTETAGLHWIEFTITRKTDMERIAMEAYTELALIISFSQINLRGIAVLN